MPRSRVSMNILFLHMISKISLKDQVYLDYAAIAPPSAEAIAAVVDFHERYLRSTDTKEFIRIETSKLKRLRSEINQTINAGKDYETVFTRSASEAISIVANGLTWHEGDEVVISDLEHPANVVPWLYLSSKCGIVVRCAKSFSTGYIDTEHLASLVSQRTRLVSISLVSHAFGTIQPINEIVNRINKYHVLLLIDAAQAIGRLPIDVQKLSCDFMVASGRKGLAAPIGTGFLCGRQSELERLIPCFVSTRNVSIDTNSATIETKIPEKLEPNLPNLGCMFGLGKSIENLKTTAISSTSHHLISLADQVVDGLGQIPSVQIPIVLPRESQVGIVSFYIHSVANSITLGKLREQGFILGTCILPKYPDNQPREFLRVSVNKTTSASDIVEFLEALELTIAELRT